jgi:hypothetical protein
MPCASAMVAGTSAANTIANKNISLDAAASMKSAPECKNQFEDLQR